MSKLKRLFLDKAFPKYLIQCRTLVAIATFNPFYLLSKSFETGAPKTLTIGLLHSLTMSSLVLHLCPLGQIDHVIGVQCVL